MFPAQHSLLSLPSVLQVHDVVEKTGIVKDGWNGYNVMHDTASRVAALDLGFLPSARSASAPPPKFVYLLGADDFAEQDIPADAFVVYQVGRDFPMLAGEQLFAWARVKTSWALPLLLVYASA